MNTISLIKDLQIIPKEHLILKLGMIGLIDKINCPRFQFSKFQKLSKEEQGFISSLYNKDFHFSSRLFYFEHIKKQKPIQFYCKTCGKELNENQVITQCKIKRLTYCCNKCAQIQQDVLQKKEKYFIQKFGVQNPSQSIEIKNKIKNHFISNYSVENPGQIPEVKEKIKQTNLDRYGVASPCKNQDIMNRLKENYKKYTGYIYPSQNPNSIEKRVSSWKKNNHINYDELNKLVKYKDKQIPEEDYNNILEKSNISRSGLNKHLKLLNITREPLWVQKDEKELLEFILSNNLATIENSKNIITPYELDIYIPELKLAIEFNGDYWHQTNKSGKNKFKQLYKTNLCESKGIRLIHIWGHEWLNNKEFIKSLLKLYIENKVHSSEFQNLLKQFGNKLPRDYFQTLDFSGKIEEPEEELINNRLKIYKTGIINVENKNI